MTELVVGYSHWNRIRRLAMLKLTPVHVVVVRGQRLVEPLHRQKNRQRAV